MQKRSIKVRSRNQREAALDGGLFLFRPRQLSATADCPRVNNAENHDQLPDSRSSRPNGADHRSDQVRVTVERHDTAAMSCLPETPQMGAKGCVGRKGRLS
jgi:hypothetical protein